MAIPGAIIGAKEGAAIGIAVSRAVKAGVRSSGAGARSGGGGRTERVERAERKINTKSDMISFRDEQCKTGKWERIGIKEGRQTYKDAKTGKLLQEDNRHYNFEVYPKGGGRHEGVLEPFTDAIDFSKADPTRILKL